MLRKIKTKLIDTFKNRFCKESSFSQDSEDEILEKIFWGKNDGFFIDIGAHHPIEYSNTYKFYLKGWSGLNIDPRPGIMDEFNRIRSKDINIEIAISEEVGEKEFYLFDAPGVNTFLKDIAFGRNILNGFKYLGSKKVKTNTLLNILDKYVGERKIDFLNIDVEGYEINILKQNDWKRYRPNVIICEMLFSDESDNPTPINCLPGSQFWSLVENLNCFETHNLLIEQGYSVFAKGIASTIYINKHAKWD